jgi:hypothetical protein
MHYFDGTALPGYELSSTMQKKRFHRSRGSPSESFELLVGFSMIFGTVICIVAGILLCSARTDRGVSGVVVPIGMVMTACVTVMLAFAYGEGRTAALTAVPLYARRMILCFAIAAASMFVSSALWLFDMPFMWIAVPIGIGILQFVMVYAPTVVFD